MSRTVRFSAIPFVLLSILLSVACDQNGSPPKPSLGIDKSIIGSWVEGKWVHSPTEDRLPEIQVSGKQMTFGQCSFALDSLLQHNEKQAYMVLKRSGDCTLSHVLSNMVMSRNSNCKASVAMYASSEDISKGTPQQTGLYSKSGYSDASTQ